MVAVNIPGRYAIEFGPNPLRRRTLVETDSATADNAAGSNPYYLNGVEKPFDDGVPLMIGPGPHWAEGELMYISVDPNTDGKVVDSDDTTAVLNVPYAEYVRRNGQLNFLGRGVINAVGQRSTTVVDGGLNDDPTLAASVQNPVYAFGPLPAALFRTLFGRLELNIVDDTA